VSMISTSKRKIKVCRQFDDTTGQLGGRRVRQVLKRLPSSRSLLISSRLTNRPTSPNSLIGGEEFGRGIEDQQIGLILGEISRAQLAIDGMGNRSVHRTTEPLTSWMERAVGEACSEARPWERALAPGHRRCCGGVHRAAVQPRDAIEPATPTSPEALDAFGMEGTGRETRNREIGLLNYKETGLGILCLWYNLRQ
jgi:hypothetical protein